MFLLVPPAVVSRVEVQLLTLEMLCVTSCCSFELVHICCGSEMHFIVIFLPSETGEL